MSPRRRSPRSVGHALDAARQRWEPATLLAEIQALWPAVVGEAIAEQASPTAERGGAVTISCAASVWAQELDLMAPSILKRLNARLNGHEVHRLRCITAPLADRPPTPEKFGRGRVDTAG